MLLGVLCMKLLTPSTLELLVNIKHDNKQNSLLGETMLLFFQHMLQLDKMWTAGAEETLID